MIRPQSRILVALALVALAGCSQAPKATTSAARQAAALEANRKGETYVRHGELENAARSYAEALRLSQSLEDAEGIAANAINLSIVRQRQGRFADARAALAVLTEQGNLRFSPLRLTEAALRHALLELDERKFSAAEDWVAKASSHCAERCPLTGAIHNVRAQLEQALALDREIGASRKIAFDLLALGRAAALAGDRDGARAYYGRALAVSEADRDGVAAAEARSLIETIDKAATGK